MTLKEIQKNLENLKTKGFVESNRRGPTGIGHTLEKELNLYENNISIPDIGGRVELKATRRNASSLITLFTFNRGVWQIPQKEVIEKFGYIDDNNRQALYNTIYFGKDNSQGLTLDINASKNQVLLVHKESGLELAIWSIFTIVGKFISKLERAIFVFAETRKSKDGKEEFYFDEAYLLENPSPDNFFEAFKNSLIAIDLRMYIKSSGTVRNHGTGIRIFEKDISHLYGKKRKLL